MIYRYRNNYIKKWIIYCSFVIAIILHITPLLPQAWCCNPSWVMILLIYWISEYPNGINIGSGFFLGLFMDIISGITLGTYALSLSILTYLTIRKINYFRHIPIWKQSCIIALFSLINQIIKILIKFFITKIWYIPEIFWNCVLDGTLWPCLMILMRKIYYLKN